MLKEKKNGENFFLASLKSLKKGVRSGTGSAPKCHVSPTLTGPGAATWLLTCREAFAGAHATVVRGRGVGAAAAAGLHKGALVALRFTQVQNIYSSKQHKFCLSGQGRVPVPNWNLKNFVCKKGGGGVGDARCA
jgi:hypothetical protein